MTILEETQCGGLWRVEILTSGGTRMVACGGSREEALARASHAEPEAAQGGRG